MLTAILIGYLGPVDGYLSQRAELAAEREQLERLEARRDSLATQLRALEREDVLESRARQLGLLKPGERGFVLKRSELEPAPAPPERRDDGVWGWLDNRF